MTEQKAKEMLKRLYSTNTCIFSTASQKGKPQSALMHFALDGDNNLLFNIFNESRKYTNLIENEQTSVVLFHDPDYAQLDGTVEELSTDDANTAKQKFITKYGDSPWYADPKMRVFKFTPTWIRVYLDRKVPPTLVEFDLRKST